MSWALKRKLLYTSVTVAFLLLTVGLPVYFALDEDPTCFDGRENGDEAGVDCGGSCKLACPFEVRDLIVRWDESFSVREGEWGAVAYVENPNDLFAENVRYTFRFVDDKGVTIGRRDGETLVPPRKVFTVFESGIDLGERSPSQEFLSFETEDTSWIKPGAEPAGLEISSIRIAKNISGTQLLGVVSNPSVREIQDIELTGILYDLEGNVIAASETYIDVLGAGASEGIVFTWPKDFGDEIARREVLFKTKPQ